MTVNLSFCNENMFYGLNVTWRFEGLKKSSEKNDALN